MSFSVSIANVFFCNFSCSYCYLSKEQLNDKTQLQLSRLDQQLAHISKYKKITQIDLYGGEITLLDKKYIIDTINIIHKYYNGVISVITNLSSVPEWLYRNDIDVSVSFDYIAREKYDIVMRNMVEFRKNFHVLTLVSSEMISWSNDTLNTMIDICNTMPKLVSVELKPYSSNQANQDNITFVDFEKFVQRWLELSPTETRQYNFINEYNIGKVLSGNGYSWSDDHIYIIPTGEFAVLDFDNNDNEMFVVLNDWTDYVKWCINEVNMVTLNTFCNKCEFVGKCLSEHLRDVKDLNNSCSGFKGLLEWYRNTK